MAKIYLNQIAHGRSGDKGDTSNVCVFAKDPKDYELIYELYFKNHTERECAQRLGMSQQAIHERKKRILKKIKNNLDEEGC